jgi:integrase
MLADGKQSTDRLFGDQNRHWVLRAVRRLCKEAAVPAHGLRGTHARLAVEAGTSGDVVARNLGHESFGVTTDHDAGQDAVADAATDRVANALEGEVGPQSVRNASADQSGSREPVAGPVASKENLN